MNQERIGKFIATCRKEKGMTQKEFAESLGVTDKTVSRWENGHYLPDVSLFHDVCKILDIEVTELLNGEKLKNQENREEVDQTIMKIINISSREMKAKKKKIWAISIAIIGMIILLFLSWIIFYKNQNGKMKPKVGDLIAFPKQIAIKEKEDGWICTFELEYLKTDIKTPYYYGYNCENFKYEELYDFMPTGQEVDADGNLYEYKTTTNHSQYLFHKEYGKDLKKVHEYFSAHKFNTVITLADLDGLNLNHISKEEILELYNEAISSPKITKWGNQIYEQYVSYMSTSMTKDDYTWKVGYIMPWGHIKYVSIELMIKNEYLSDLVKQNKATEEQKELYKNILEIKKNIIAKQTFHLPKQYQNQKPYSFLNENFSEIKQLEK